jgi:hypothetical protein
MEGIMALQILPFRELPPFLRRRHRFASLAFRQCVSSNTISPTPAAVLTNESRQNSFIPFSSAIEQSTIDTSSVSAAISP